MARIDLLKAKIDNLYLAKNKDRAEWADWLHANHIFIVAQYARELAERFGANKELAMAGGMLHDIADTAMSRFDPRHEKESARIARELLSASGFTKEEIAIVVDDAIKHHSCRDDRAPQSIEGKILATADALVHLRTNYYHRWVQFMKQKMSANEVNASALKKLDRDFYKKILFDETREEVREEYESLKNTLEELSA